MICKETANLLHADTKYELMMTRILLKRISLTDILCISTSYFRSLNSASIIKR
jgi:hypothetical protein